VVIAGSGPEGEALQAQAKRLGLSNVIFAGQVTKAEKLALLKACRALVLPSHLRSEAYGMVLVEASIFGKPMISCEINTGTSFVNKHFQTGIVVPPGSPTDLANAMNTLLENVSVAEGFGQAARQRYEMNFSGPVLGEAYARLYREVLENKRN
jgi:rhamnosyl/mannosyltransferase